MSISCGDFPAFWYCSFYYIVNRSYNAFLVSSAYFCLGFNCLNVNRYKKIWVRFFHTSSVNEMFFFLAFHACQKKKAKISSENDVLGRQALWVY